MVEKKMKILANISERLWKPSILMMKIGAKVSECVSHKNGGEDCGESESCEWGLLGDLVWYCHHGNILFWQRLRPQFATTISEIDETDPENDGAHEGVYCDSHWRTHQTKHCQMATKSFFQRKKIVLFILFAE